VGVEPIVITFDCGRSGWYPNGASMLTDNVGSVTFTPTANDPFMVLDADVDGTALTEVAFEVNVADAPGASFPAAFFWFASGGHGRVGYTLDGNGDYTVRLNPGTLQDSGTGAWDASIYRMRLDFPDGPATDFINAGTMFTLDWMAVSDDPNYTPAMVNDAANDCDGDGLSNGYEAALGTDPFDDDTDNDGVSDGLEVQFGTDPLDGESTPQIPVGGGLALVALALGLALAAVSVLRRRTA